MRTLSVYQGVAFGRHSDAERVRIASRALEREGRQTNSHVVRTLFPRRPVADPLARFRNNRLPATHVHHAPFIIHMQETLEDKRNFPKDGTLSWFGSARGTAHVGYADIAGFRIHVADVLIDALAARHGDPSRLFNESGHDQFTVWGEGSSASTSISTSIRESMRPFTSTIVVAGRVWPRNSK